jgi:hypothetical protein
MSDNKGIFKQFTVTYKFLQRICDLKQEIKEKDPEWQFVDKITLLE